MTEQYICRMCSQQFVGSSVVNLFKYQTQIFDNVEGQVFLPINVIRKYNSYHFKISSDDNLPQHICQNCLESFYSINEFMENCLESQKHLESESRKLNIQIKSSKQINNEMSDKDICSSPLATISYSKNKKTALDLENSLQSPIKSNHKTRKIAEETFDEMMQHFMEHNGNISHDDELCNSETDGKTENVKECKFDSDEEYFNDNFKEDFRIMCKFCSKEASTVQKLDEHLENKHKHKIYSKFMICECCGKLIRNCDFDDHVLFCQDGKYSHFCDICNKGFSTLRNMKNHKTRHAKPRKQTTINRTPLPKASLQCLYCPQKFRNTVSLVNHCKLHSKTDVKAAKFICSYCKATFKRADHLNLHENSQHLKSEQFKCRYCDKVFYANFVLNHHVKHMHSGNKERVLCEYCNKTLRNKRYLKQHILEFHSTNKNLKCPICDERFHRRVQLTLHSKIHDIFTNDETNKKVMIEKIIKDNVSDVNKDKIYPNNEDSEEIFKRIE